MKISAVIICFNEEKKIARCLESVAWADEIVVLDSFSNDSTLKICSKYTDKVYQHEFEGHIEQKNRALDLCKFDWVFSIDADEVVSEELKNSILKLKELDQTKDIHGFFVNRKIYYLGKWIEHTNWYPDFKLRLFKRSKAKWGGINPHDTIILDGAAEKLQGDLFHYSYDDVSAHLQTIDKFTSIMAREYYANGKKASIWNITLRPIFGFFKSYILKKGFLEGKRGWMIALLDGYYVLLKFLKIYEIQVNEKKNEN